LRSALTDSGSSSGRFIIPHIVTFCTVSFLFYNIYLIINGPLFISFDTIRTEYSTQAFLLSVRSLGGRSYADSVLVDNILISLSKSLLVIYSSFILARACGFWESIGFASLSAFLSKIPFLRLFMGKSPSPCCSQESLISFLGNDKRGLPGGQRAWRKHL
jgi:hypothetical protein